MSANLVTVTIAVSAAPNDTMPSEGNFVFSPNGILWPGTPGSLPVVPMIQQGHLVNSTASVQLLASDNFSAGVLGWDIIINIRGMPTINCPGVVINFATGPTQSVWDILNAFGYTFISQP